MKKLLAFVLLAVALSVLPGRGVEAAIVIDGNNRDWLAHLRLTDTTGSEEGEADLVSWGAVISDGVLFGFFEMTRDISEYASGTNDIWAGLWIDVDMSGGPGNTPSSLGHRADHLGTEWDAGVFESFDIIVEWGVNTSHWGEGFNYWGAGDNAAQQGSPVSDGLMAYSGKVIEFSVPIADILAELGTYPDAVTAMGAWRIGARVEAAIEESGWGGDNSDTLALCSFLSADINGDGMVGSADLDIIRANWGRTVTPGDRLSGDLSGDGFVSSADLDLVRAFWGQSFEPYVLQGVSSVPEPAIWVLLPLAALMIFGRRKRSDA